MADDIDIEEHDLLQNPMIKKIFPDLSVLKQEIMDFDEDLPEKAANSNETDKNISINELKITSGNVNIPGANAQSNEGTCFRTKIILGSKPSKATKNTKSDLKKDVKVMVQNITPYITRTMRFCDACLILFPNKRSLNNHKLTVHTSGDYGSKRVFPLCFENEKKYMCIECLTEFTTQDKLRRHKRNIHHTDLRNNKESIIRSQIKEDNVIVETFDLQSNVTSTCKPCFHCNKLFPNQQDLIDHLYTILYAKKAQVSQVVEEQNRAQEGPTDKTHVILQKNFNVSSDIDIETHAKVNELKSIYSCPICSYYFIEESFCKNHVIVKHKAMKNMQIDQILFNPLCKFCHFKHDDILSYNSHLRKFHKIEMLKQVNSVLPSNNIEARKFKSNNLRLHESSTTIGKYSKQLTSLVENSKRSIYDNIQVTVSKIILYKCSVCDIHFLTYDAAFKHFEHLRFHENWECSNCDRLFKNKDANVHRKQHKYSNYFRCVKVYADIQPRILYKCSLCAVHFNKEKISEHHSICQSEQSQSTESSYCKICGIFIESSIKQSHEDDHNLKKFTRFNFEIIDSELPVKKDNNNVVKNCLDDPNILVKPYLPDSITTDYDKPANLNIKNKGQNIKKISKNLFAKKHLTYNYCNVCKCNTCRVYKTDVHIKLLCVNILKYICKYCGLMFSNKSITSHRRLHYTNKTLKLQDFTFYNLQTNKVMKPLIPEFPKCELCETHFIAKSEVKGHLCDINDYSICSICKTKFSETAYKLHMPFHTYNLKGRSKQSIDVNYKIKSRCDRNEINDCNLLDNKIPIIYTCKNCNLSISTYDEVIEHCHLHTNLNKVEVNAVECTTCQLKFSNSSYNNHLEFHRDLENVKFTRFHFDLVYFGSDNNKWLKHVHKSLSKLEINTLIRDSIYKYETRIKMGVVQKGPSNLIIYKCEKCQCIIDCNSIYNHVAACCPHSEISYCTFCGLSFACSITRNNHEKIHTTPDITIKSYRIVMFNREQDLNSNYNISNLKKCYVVYECRFCHVLVENYNYIYHICFRSDCKKCNFCGLLICVENFNDHILKHKQVPSFNDNKIKVVLLGSKTAENITLNRNNDLVPTFSGIVCDYTFYKCTACEVCVRDVRNTVRHSCLIDAAKSQCIKCDLIFDEGKLKGHLKLHDTDPDFTRETIRVKPFTNRKPNKSDRSDSDKPNKLYYIEIEKNKKIFNKNIEDFTTVQTQGNPKTAKLFKCSCGLHYVHHASLEEHMKKCTGKNKSVQSCSKCGLSFTSDVLFKHLLEHHGDKNVGFKYEIVENMSQVRCT